MADITYYDYINNFYDLLQVNPVSSNAQLLYHTLLMIFNRAHWECELQRTNYNICGLCGLGEKSMSAARNELKQMGLIDFKTDKRRGQATKYKLCSSFCTPDLTVQKEVQTPDKGSTKEEQKQNKGRTYKDKREEKEDVRGNTITPLSPFTGLLDEKVQEWLQYKKERRQTYKPTGLKNLFALIKKNAEEYGDEAVIGVIDRSISSNWNGLFFDKLEQQRSVYNQQSGNVFLDLAEGGESF
jgi:hypothetical protein